MVQAPRQTQSSPPTWERIATFVLGVMIIITLLALAVLFPNPTQFEYTVFRIILSLGVSAIAAFIPGFINVNVPGYLQAGGALAIFWLVFHFSPAELIVVPPPTPPQSLVVIPPSPGPQTAQSTAPSILPKLIYDVCHGELERVCGQHPYNKFESCADGGASPQKSCLKVCGKPLGAGSCEAQQTASSIGGNQCGYAWFQVRCF